MNEPAALDEMVVKRVYARWAPFYDFIFGWLVKAGCRRVMDYVNRTPGRLLEVGVGTGLSLDKYRPDMEVTAIDLSPEMLARARAKANRLNLKNVHLPPPMDAARMDFEDGTFDKVVAMYVLTVVPEPARVMAELERVCKPGGEVIVVNHFSTRTGVRGLIERLLAPLAGALGWRPEFPIEKVLGQQFLKLADIQPFGLLGMFALLRFERVSRPVDHGASTSQVADHMSRTGPASRARAVAAGLRRLRE